MKYIRILFAAGVAAVALACQPKEDVIFGIEVGTEDGNITIGPEGGIKTIEVKSPDSWVVEASEPWITVSPANGRGSVLCNVVVDSTLVVESRIGKVRVKSLADDSVQDFSVRQSGYEYQIVVDEPTRNIEDFAAFDSRSFDVEVLSNVDFEVVMPEQAQNWLSFKKPDLVLDRGARPRKVKIHFDWKVNSREEERLADVEFIPVEAVEMWRHDTLKVIQKGALPIPVGTPAGDSLAVLAISRALNMYTEWNTSEKMEHWNNVNVWKDGPNKGRVKYVQFFMFNTKEELPYEVQYLTAAEEIAFYSNANQFMKSLDTGEAITKLTQLKRLTLGAYGLTSLHKDFGNLKNLEYLDLSSNCFEEIPDVLTPENFPNLHSLVMNANQRYTIYDLSNDIRENIGGLIEVNLSTSKGMESFKRILKWEKLDTVRLSVNYIQGELPDMKGEVPEWTIAELKDSLVKVDKSTGDMTDAVTGEPVSEAQLAAKCAVLEGLPKVLPNANFFAINFNRFTGKLPDWVLYHPKLDLMIPYSLIFSQEGKTKEGKSAGFDNEPVSLDPYYTIYANKTFNPNRKDK